MNPFADFLVMLAMVALLGLVVFGITQPYRTQLAEQTKECEAKDGTLLVTKSKHVCVQNATIIGVGK